MNEIIDTNGVKWTKIHGIQITRIPAYPGHHVIADLTTACGVKYRGGTGVVIHEIDSPNPLIVCEKPIGLQLLKEILKEIENYGKA